MKDIILTIVLKYYFMNTKMAEILNLSALQKNTAEQDIKTIPNIVWLQPKIRNENDFHEYYKKQTR